MFKKRYPDIDLYDFEFVKRERNVIITPVVKDNHAWDFSDVKHLCGNGRLYVRLKAESNERASGEAGDKCQENIATVTTSESSAFTSSQVYSNVYLRNTDGANA